MVSRLTKQAHIIGFRLRDEYARHQMMPTIESAIERMFIAVSYRYPLRITASSLTGGHVATVQLNVGHQLEICPFTLVGNGHPSGSIGRHIHRVGRIEIEGAARVDTLRKRSQLLRRPDGEWIRGRTILRLHRKSKRSENKHYSKKNLFLEFTSSDIGLYHHAVICYG